MAPSMIVKWTCDLHGDAGRIEYETPAPNEIAFRDALNAHHVQLSADLWSAAGEHLDKFRIAVRRKRAASHQQQLFDGDQP